jgi:hypothetical protein
MPTNDGFTPNHPLPLFLSEHADEPDFEKAWDRAVISSRILKTSILVVTASVIAILLVENPVALFANVTASLVNISALQPGTDHSTPTIQSTAGTQALPPTATDAPTRDEIAAAFEPADQSQTEVSQPPAEALFKQFQAWSAEQNARAPVGPVRPVQDAPAQVVQNAPPQVRPVQKHRQVRHMQNARAEIRREQNPRAKVQREENARVPVAPVQDARAQDPAGQNAQAPSLLPSFGWRDQTQ